MAVWCYTLLFPPPCSRCVLLEFLSAVRGEPTQNYPKNEFQGRLLKVKTLCPVIWPVCPHNPPPQWLDPRQRGHFSSVSPFVWFIATVISGSRTHILFVGPNHILCGGMTSGLNTVRVCQELRKVNMSVEINLSRHKVLLKWIFLKEWIKKSMFKNTAPFTLTFTFSDNLESPISLSWLFLDCGRKPA